MNRMSIVYTTGVVCLMLNPASGIGVAVFEGQTGLS